MRVLRIEHADDGTGPYKNWRTASRLTGTAATCPLPEDDGLSSLDRSTLWFGFKDERQLFNWFNRDMLALHEMGYVVREYWAPLAREGGRQVVFDLPRSHPIAEYDILDFRAEARWHRV